MKQCHLARIVLVLMLAAAGTFSFVPTTLSQGSDRPAGPQAPSTAGAQESASSACLGCHGPFEKLASAPPFFAAPSGEKINPHRYVPHDLKEIPDCVSCHKPHSATPSAAEIAALPKPNVTSCFECHHTKTFQNCQDCHKKG
jgi:predicted CXXCH cytochrome family protein